MTWRELNAWLLRGVAVERYAKNFVFAFAIMALLLSGIHGAGVWLHCVPSGNMMLYERPFVSEWFWSFCFVSAALGAAGFTFWPPKKDNIPQRT